MTTETFSVPEVHCNHCVDSIEGAVSKLPGVDTVAVSLEDTSVAVSYDGEPAVRSAIVGAIEEQGYTVGG